MQFPLAFAETIHHADGDERMVALSDHNEFPPLLSAKPDGDEWHWVRKQELKEEPMNVHLADDNWEYVTYEVSKPLYAEVAERAAHLPSAPRRRPMKEQAGLRRRRQRIQLFEMQDDHDLGEEMWAVYKSAKMRRRRYNARSFHRHADLINRVFYICTDQAMSDLDVLPDTKLDHTTSRRVNSLALRLIKICSTMPEPNVPREKWTFSLEGEQELEKTPWNKLPKGLQCELL